MVCRNSQERLATSAAEAAEAANALGYPVALKIASPDLPHKTEAGGVVLGLQSQHSVTAAYDQIIAFGASATSRTHASRACWCRRWRRAGMSW